MATAFDVIHLGTTTDLDPTEGDTNAKYAGGDRRHDVGGSGIPLFGSIQSWSPGSTGYGGGPNDWACDTDNIVSNDTFSIDGGSDQTLVGTVIYNATVTYFDGSSDTLHVSIAQDTAGNLYVVPQPWSDTDQEKLEENRSTHSGSTV